MDFVGTFLLLLVFGIIASSILMGLGWFILHFSFHNNESLGNVYGKTIAVTAVICLLVVTVFFLCDRFGIRWESRF